jgi:hypothetical protein
MANNSGLLVLGALGVGAYLTRTSWLPTFEADFPSIAALFPPGTPLASGAAATNPTAPLVTTGNTPITASTPGAVPVGTGGCFLYPNGTGGAVVLNCPPGVSPPPTTPTANTCANGYTMDAAGVCTEYSDAMLLANLNSIPWTGLNAIPAEQIQRLDPQILAQYVNTQGVNQGTVLAYMLGLGDSGVNGQITNGSDGNAYQYSNGVFILQGTASGNTQPSTLSGVPMRARLGSLASALPITNAVLIEASSNPAIAALVGTDPRAMLTAQQWNYYYAQATGIIQAVPLNPPGDPSALMSAAAYQAARRAAGLMTTQNLGSIRSARRGAFPLGAINQWVPPGNRTIFRIPGRGAVPAGRGGGVPAPAKLGVITNGGGNHRWARSPFPRPSWWREANS